MRRGEQRRNQSSRTITIKTIFRIYNKCIHQIPTVKILVKKIYINTQIHFLLIFFYRGCTLLTGVNILRAITIAKREKHTTNPTISDAIIYLKYSMNSVIFILYSICYHMSSILFM